jgi:hypothetical protein
MSEITFPTEIIELPSKGLLYPEGHPLSSGTIEMKYMTAREEEILSNQNLIQKGLVLDKLIESLIVTKFNYKDLLVVDKNALLFAARVLAYGADYQIKMNHPETNEEEIVNINLAGVDNKPLHSVYENCGGVNNFEFDLPHSKVKITFRLLTHGDEQEIEQEIATYKKIKKEYSEALIRLERIITSVNGDTNKGVIRNFVTNQFLARDVREFRKYMKEISPDVDTKVDVTFEDGYVMQGVEVPITLNFFWPDFNL